MKRTLVWLLLLTVPALGQIPGLNSGRVKRPAFPPPEQEWAVLVGVSKYAKYPQTEWLEGCDRDATDLAAFLQSPRGGDFPAGHVKLLVNEQATVTAVRLALDFLIKNARAGDVIYLFFACHGKVEPYGSGDVGYLMLHDSDPQFLNATALPMDEVRRYVDVNLRQSSQVVLITDACHAGGTGPGPNDRRQAFTSVADHLLEIGERDGVLNIMACRRNENAVEDPRLGGHGVLTYCLLRALNGDAGAGPDGYVRAQDVLEYVMRYVPRLTDQQQHPRHSSNYRDEFPMAKLALAGPLLNLPDPPSSTVTSVDAPSAVLGGKSATLRVVGARRDAELYLVQGTEQRTIGRVLSDANVLVVENLPPGRYQLVQSLGGEQRQWQVDLTPGRQSFDVRN